MKMTKSIFVGGALVSALVLGATNVNADDMEWDDDDNQEQLSGEAQKAADKAVAEYGGKVTEIEYDEDDGQYYYEIEIENNGEDFDVKVKADDLSIIEDDLDVDDRDDDIDEAEDDRDDDRDEADERDDDDLDDRNEVQAAEKTSKSSNENTNQVALEDAFESDKVANAVKKAQEEFDGILESVNYQEDDGDHYYEVTLVNKNDEYEVKYNVNDLKVIDEERDDDSDDFKNVEKAQDVKILSLQDAKALAKSEVDGTITEWDYDVDDFEYDFEIGDYEVKINAKTGEVTEVED